MKTVKVTRVQKWAAQWMVTRAEEKGETVSDAIRKIAEAQPPKKSGAADSGGTVKPEPMTHDNQAALLGEHVDVFIGAEDGENVIVSGQLLAFGQGGDFEVLCDDGMVHYCWPLLGIRPQSGSE